MAVSDWCKRRLFIDQKTTGHNPQPSNAMVLKARQELSPLENSVADFTRVNSAKIEIWTSTKIQDPAEGIGLWSLQNVFLTQSFWINLLLLRIHKQLKFEGFRRISKDLKGFYSISTASFVVWIDFSAHNYLETLQDLRLGFPKRPYFWKSNEVATRDEPLKDVVGGLLISVAHFLGILRVPNAAVVWGPTLHCLRLLCGD